MPTLKNTSTVTLSTKTKKSLPLRELCAKIVLVCSVLQDKVLMDENKQKMRRAIWRRRPGVTARALSLPPAPSLDNGHATGGHVHTAHVLRCQRRLRRFLRPVLFTCVCVCVCEYVRKIVLELSNSLISVSRSCPGRALLTVGGLNNYLF